MAIISFVVGLLGFLKVQIVGELYVAELLLPLAAVVAVTTRAQEEFLRTPLFRVLVASILLMVAGYVGSDFIRGTPTDAAMRGWGRAVLVGTNFIALAAIGAADRRNLWWFALGYGLGGLLYLRFGVNLSFTIWKHGMGVDKGYAVYVVPLFAALCYFLPARVGAAGFVFLGVYSAHYDFRTFTAVCFFIAGAMFLRGRNSGGSSKITAKALIAGGLAAIAMVLALSAAISYREDDASGRRQSSDDTRATGLRFGLYAVLNSPIIGYGSWGQSQELGQLYRKAAQDQGQQSGNADVQSGSTASVHAQLLQAWSEAGILAAVFFLVLMVEGIRRLPFAVLARPLDLLTPILLYWIIHGLWNLWGSPFSAPLRLELSMMAVAAVIIAADARRLSRGAGGSRALGLRRRRRIAPVSGGASPG